LSENIRIYSPQTVETEDLCLEGEDFHYLAHVHRIRVGRRCILFGKGDREIVCEVAEVGKSSIRLRKIETRRVRTESPVHLTLFVATGKGKKLEEVVEKTTSLGVARIVPFVGARSVAFRSNPRLRERLEKIAVEACHQCGRTCPPEISEVAANIQEALDGIGSENPRLCCLDEAGGEDLIAAATSCPLGNEVGLFCGPEGGWSEGERGLLRRSGAKVVSLGPRILRTELAAVVGVALLERLLSSRHQYETRRTPTLNDCDS